ncbi:MAG: glucosamine-6-phosphate deaminase [Mycoplasmoidaceae bacterium]
MKNIKLIICKDENEISELASQIIIDTVIKNKKSNLGLATGSSPLGTYKKIIEKYNNGDISLKNIRTFNLDEYLDIKKDDYKNTYAHYMDENLFSKTNINKKRTFFPTLLANKPNDDYKKFEDKIRKYGNIDIQLLGLGTNGHIGFNEPGSEINTRTRIVDLAQSTIESNSKYFNSKDDVPKRAVSMGLGTILESEKILLIAFGKEKSDAIKAFFEKEEFHSDLPMSALWEHNNVLIIIDEEAASKADKNKINNFLIKND